MPPSPGSASASKRARTTKAKGRPGDGSMFIYVFHPLYGIVFPLLTLFFAHKWAREGRYHPHAVFGVAGLVVFGLTARAMMVGLGIG